MKGTREEGGSRCHGVVLVTKVVPLAPFINEYTEVRRVSVKFEQKLVQVMAGMWGLQVYNNIDARLNIYRFWLLYLLYLQIEGGRTLCLNFNVYWPFRATIHI